jgi:predicted nucleic acid-binding Zn ribbon protein
MADDSSSYEDATYVGQGAGGGTLSGEKICCICGKSVAGQKRFKDSEGKYWCYECGMQDTVTKHPEKGQPCGDCEKRFPPSQLSEYDGVRLCEVCVAARRVSKKRQEARIARAAESDRERRERTRLIIMAVAALVIIALIIGYAVT